MWDEIKGYVVAFVALPLALGGVWYVGYRAVTGEWPNIPAFECSTDWDGRSNPADC